jgi:hypothetical protein
MNTSFMPPSPSPATHMSALLASNDQHVPQLTTHCLPTRPSLASTAK